MLIPKCNAPGSGYRLILKILSSLTDNIKLHLQIKTVISESENPVNPSSDFLGKGCTQNGLYENAPRKSCKSCHQMPEINDLYMQLISSNSEFENPSEGVRTLLANPKDSEKLF